MNFEYTEHLVNSNPEAKLPLQGSIFADSPIRKVPSTAIVTSIYSEFWGTKQFRKSCERLDLYVHNAFVGKQFRGNGEVIEMIYNKLAELKSSYDYAIYADGADSIFLKSFTPPDYVLYSTEKAVWPPTNDLKKKWEDYYAPKQRANVTAWQDDSVGYHTFSTWKYLNGGGYCGPIKLLMDFLSQYVSKYMSRPDVNGQGEQALAFFDAHKIGFPIKLDTQCQYFQTTGFAEQTDFYSDGKIFKNVVTQTEPCILHGNGRTDMKWIYENLNK